MSRVCRQRACQVGGGIRDITTARRWLDAGATRVIVGSTFFAGDRVDIDTAAGFSAALGDDRLIAAVDSRAGRVVTQGWRHDTGIDLMRAVRALSPFVGSFLATLVETEGLMQGLDFDHVSRLRAATDRRLIVAGGVRHMDDVHTLEKLGADAVAGMAIYTGAIAM